MSIYLHVNQVRFPDLSFSFSMLYFPSNGGVEEPEQNPVRPFTRKLSLVLFTFYCLYFYCRNMPSLFDSCLLFTSPYLFCPRSWSLELVWEAGRKAEMGAEAGRSAWDCKADIWVWDRDWVNNEQSGRWDHHLKSGWSRLQQTMGITDGFNPRMT